MEKLSDGNFNIFSAMQILCEINCSHVDTPKTHFEYLGIFDIFKCEIPQELKVKIQSKSPKNSKNGSFWPSEIRAIKKLEK